MSDSQPEGASHKPDSPQPAAPEITPEGHVRTAPHVTVDPTGHEMVDHVDVADGASIGHGAAEPESPQPAAEPAPEPAPTEEQPAPAAAEDDDPRAAIYDRHREQRAAEEAEVAALPPEQQAQVDRMRLEAGVQPEPAAEPAPAPQPTAAQPAQPPAQPAQPAAPEGVATTDELVTIRVYGQEQQVPHQEVVQAGIETLQKERAADARLERVATYEREVRQYHGDCDAYREELRRGNASAVSPGETAPPAPPDPGAPEPALSDDVLQEVATDIYSGEPERTVEGLKKFAAGVVQGRGNATPPSVDEIAEAVVPRALDAIVARDVEQERVNANEVFRDEYADIHGNPDLMAVAQYRMGVLHEDPANEGRSMLDLAREVGAAVRQQYLPSQPSPATQPGGQQPGPDPAPQPAVTDELAQRRLIKRETVVPTSEAHVAQPKPAEPSYPSNSDYVKRMREERGQPPV